MLPNFIIMCLDLGLGQKIWVQVFKWNQKIVYYTTLCQSNGMGEDSSPNMTPPPPPSAPHYYTRKGEVEPLILANY